MQTAALIFIAEESAGSSWNTPAWVLIVLIISTILSGYSSAVTTLLSFIIRDVRDRLARGDAKFDDLYDRTADGLVKHALSDGALRSEMARDFVSRDEWQKTNERVARIELELTREVTKLTAAVDHLTAHLDRIGEPSR